MKNTNTAKNTKNAWTFAANTVTVNNRTFEASYSIGKAEDVYVFAKINNVPIRIHVGKDMPEYAACLAAAQVKPEPKPAQGAKPAEQPKAEPKPAEQPKAEPKPAEQPYDAHGQGIQYRVRRKDPAHPGSVPRRAD